MATMAVEHALNLRCGELVEVRSEEEILATLDANGELEGLPFMPELLQFCGRRLRVYRRADKTCDTISGLWRGRRMLRTVHLQNARCDGSAHGGCEAKCMIFWKEAWLRRVEPKPKARVWELVVGMGGTPPQEDLSTESCSAATLRAKTLQDGSLDAEDPAYRCQATELLRASSPLEWWSPGSYLRDWLSGNVSLVFMLRAIAFRCLYQLVRKGKGYRVKRSLYKAFARLLGEVPWPYGYGTLTGPTPKETLDLQPGERVQVKSPEEILVTLNGMKNRGLSFAPEMVRYCGQTHRVLARVGRILNEQTGKMMRLPNDCIILEGVVCQSECSSHRLFCSRSIYPYWREIWLRRVPDSD
jgi:hypothetical protein